MVSVVAATLTVLPNRSQFFQYESVHLSCGNHGNSSKWTLKRSTSLNNSEDSDQIWTGTNGSNWYIQNIYWFDSGTYWCESAAGGRCSNTINISVTEGSVILESPVVPVTEGEAVTLRCRNWTASSSSLNTDFYKDGRLIRSNTTATLTIHSVLKSDEGLYKCKISGAGESVESRLSVRESPPELRSSTRGLCSDFRVVPGIIM
ncbi:sialoadhesin-like [Mastacembelus armatus]|uniref:sialoadhesin-like n=1 Tax=Mastacembelus armatus TaxID=205130 RepID=UPI000E45EA26|nr:sialoadhesin-like [Mastacembelus armatus]